MISKKEVEDALNEFFDHKLVYNGIIQIFSNAIYFPNGLNGKKILELYKKLKLNNKYDEEAIKIEFEKYLMENKK